MLYKYNFGILVMCCLMLQSIGIFDCRANVSQSFLREYGEQELQEFVESERVVPVEQESSSDEENDYSDDSESDSDDDSGYAADNDGLQFQFDEEVRMQKEKEKLASRPEEDSLLEQLANHESDSTHLDLE